MAERAVFVGDLAPQVTAAELEALLGRFGAVELAPMRRDARTQLSSTVATFATAEAAAEAMRELNCVQVQGRAIRVVPREMDAKVRREAVGNLHVSGLDPAVQERELLVAFAAVAPVTSCRIARDPQGASRGYGYVSFETDEAAQQAIARFDKSPFGPNNTPLVVKAFERSRDRRGPAPRFTNLYVKGLRYDTTDATLLEKFGEHGEVTSHVLKKDAQGRPFAFVAYKDPEAAVKAVEELHNAIVEGLSDAELYVQKAMGRREREEELRRQFAAEEQLAAADEAAAAGLMPPPPPGAVVGGMPPPMMGPPMMGPPMMPYGMPMPGPNGLPPHAMPPPRGAAGAAGPAGPAGPGARGGVSLFFRVDAGVSADVLRRALSQCGQVVSLRPRKDRENRPFQSGFVTFETPAQAAQALETLAGKVIAPGTRPLHLAEPQPRRGGYAQVPPGGPVGHPQPAAMWGPVPSGMPPHMYRGGPPPGMVRGPMGMPPPNGHARMNGHGAPNGRGGAAGPQGYPQRGGMPPPTTAPVSSTRFSSLSGQEQRDAVSNEIRNKISEIRGSEIARQVTPVLMERMSDIAELLGLLDSPGALQASVDEAMRSLAPSKPLN